MTNVVDGGGRVRRFAAALIAPFAAILFPSRRVGVEVAAGRYGLPLLVVVLCAGLAALALGARLELAPEVLAEHAEVKPTKGTGADDRPAEVKTDREIEEETTQRTAVARVTLGLEAGLMTPGRVLFLGFALFLLGRFIGGKPTTTGAMTAAALAALPGAVRSVVTAAAAWHQPAIGTADLGTLVATVPIPDGHPVLARLAGGVDLFTCWAVVVLAFGLCAAADVKRTRGFVAIAVGFVLYLLVTRLIMGGAVPAPGASG